MTILEQLTNHPLHTQISVCQESLSVVENDDGFLAGLSEYGVQTINRINTVIIQLKNQLNAVDPYLTRKYTLDQILPNVNNIISNLQNYKNVFLNDANLNNINSYLEAILAHSATIYHFSDSASLEGLRESASSYRRAVAQHKRILENQQEELEEKSVELSSKLSEIDSTYQEFLTELNNKIDGYQDIIKETEKNFSETNSEQMEQFQQSFDKTIEAFKQEWAELLASKEDVINSSVDNLKAFQKSVIDETQTKQEEYDATLNEHKKSVESLVGIISTNSISGHFKEVADKKEQLTTIWQRTTILGFILTIGFGVYAFIISSDLDWPSLVARFIVTTALGSFTAYAARQAAKNEMEEKSNRKMEVELKTLNPYIASFDEKDQIKLKEQLFPLIFGRTNVIESNPEQSPNAPSNQIQVSPQDVTNITNVIEILKGFTNTNKGT